MPSIRFDDGPDGRLAIVADGRRLADYVYSPQDARRESPRPYLHPLRTLAGELVSLYRPHDHVWHKGLSWSLPVVGDENFWGGPSYLDGEGYVQLPNNGEQRHVGFGPRTSGDRAEITERLDWVTEGGATIMREDRTIAAAVADDETWVLTLQFELQNVSGAELRLGSPSTRGRPDAGYGGLFWRAPRSFEGATVLTPDGDAGEEVRGSRAEWLGLRGTQDGSGRASSVVMVDDAGNTPHPPEWFVRTSEYAGACPAPFFSAEHPVGPGETYRARYAVVIADEREVADGGASLDGSRLAGIGAAALAELGAEGARAESAPGDARGRGER
ncbi:MAG: PmoA family protein [Actinobacteria bacterium]|nr:PmoA family protein [Actinomycetota bacterium]MBU1608769.1 PmoA family protein [Actinomycetota bacterium]MBU2314842.1 PmoA family protein [Actinomycetota bacterium]MBU2385830.1 PmoA family protein [Actinomycetota bacterium]